MPKSRAYELRLPADWPPAAVTINGKPLAQGGKSGWSFQGNTLTTVIPVPSGSVAAKVIVEVRRAAGLTARRAELDGFAGAMTRLRGAYDAIHQTWPVSDPPDSLVDAMQAGDRLGYHPERATAEIAHFHDVLPKAQADITKIGAAFTPQLESYVKRMTAKDWRLAGTDMETQRQHRLDAMAKAERQVAEAGK
jgi:alpha-glucosidase